jgi:hypothetical protein
MLCRDHPLTIAETKGAAWGEGTSYVPPKLNAFRMSKSEGPRLELIAPGDSTFAVFPNVEPADAVSIECDQLYEASACKPRFSRRLN